MFKCRFWWISLVLRNHFHLYLLTTKGRQSLISLCAYDIVFKTTALKKQPARLFRMQNGEENTYRVVLKTKRRKTTKEKQTKQHKNKKTPNTHQKHSHKFRGETTDDKEIAGPYTRDEGESASVHRRTADQQRTLHTNYISIYIICCFPLQILSHLINFSGDMKLLWMILKPNLPLKAFLWRY